MPAIPATARRTLPRKRCYPSCKPGARNSRQTLLNTSAARPPNPNARAPGIRIADSGNLTSSLSNEVAFDDRIEKSRHAASQTARPDAVLKRRIGEKLVAKIGSLETDLPETELPAQGAFGLGSWREGRHTRIAVWDLSPAKGAVSDLAFFLEPVTLISRYYAAYSWLGYLFRLTASIQQLPTKISIPYEESDWIVKSYVEGDSFDPFHQSVDWKAQRINMN